MNGTKGLMRLAAGAVVATTALVSSAAAALAGGDAVVSSHEGFTAEKNNESYWTNHYGDIDHTSYTGSKIDKPGGSQYLLTQEYAYVIVKAGSDERLANTIFVNPQAGELVWADTNGDKAYNAGGKGGDKNISHIIFIKKANTGPVNSPPTALDDLLVPGVQDRPMVIKVLDNDTDPDGDPLTISGATHGAHGAVAINNGGTITYTPEAGFVGTDTFTYTIADEKGGSDTATVTVEVTKTPEKNSPPVASPDKGSTREGTSVTIAVLDNDSDPDRDELTVEIARDGEHGTATVNDDGTITYTPKAGFVGKDTFTYTITDENGDTDTATVTITVKDSPPKAVNDKARTDEDAAVTITVLDNDTDRDRDALKVTGATDGKHGTVKVNTDGTITYTPKAGFVGKDTFTYTITDGHRRHSDTAKVIVIVSEAPDEGDPNDPPSATDDTASTPGRTAAVIDVIGNDTDPDGDRLTVVDVTPGAHGTVEINPDGTVTYTPEDGFDGTDTFTYTITDGEYEHYDTGTVTVTVTKTPGTGTGGEPQEPGDRQPSGDPQPSGDKQPGDPQPVAKQAATAETTPELASTGLPLAAIALGGVTSAAVGSALSRIGRRRDED